MGWLDKMQQSLEGALEKTNDALTDLGKKVSEATSGGSKTTAAPTGALADAARQVPAVAAPAFPDDPDVRWTVARTWSIAGLALVETVPSADVGYPRFTFAFRQTGDTAVPIGIYVPQGGGWSLLSSQPGEAPPPTLPG